MPRAAKSSSNELLPLLIAGAAIGWIAWQATTARPTSGRDWRGIEGTVRLVPSVVYRMEMHAPFSTDPQLDGTSTSVQEAVRAALESGGARNLSFHVTGSGVQVQFDQSYPDARTLTFGQSSVGPFTALTARRLDGLPWEAP